ncbi:MAG: FHA domain-containing protein [Desulfatitalea sp.]|nr:FHA domain-containing protein [Desulfatitalea sp.]NNK02864.1 FHA domain-containing protein [Desulfatitalea sp.]
MKSGSSRCSIHIGAALWMTLWLLAVSVSFDAWPAFSDLKTHKIHKRANAPIDLMFVIDNSGSMKKNDPEFNTPKVVESFVRRLPPNSQVGMILFDASIHLLEPLHDLATDQARQQFIDSLKTIDYRGRYTDSAAGIERALYELKSNGRQAARRGIIFITDGIMDTGNAKRDGELTQWLKQDLTAECKDQQVRIFGIAFTEAADFILIQSLAARTDGEYYRTYEASGILAVLEDILLKLNPPPAPSKVIEASPETHEPQNAIPLPSEPPQVVSAPYSTPEEPRPQNKSGVELLFVVLAVVVTVLAAILVFFYLKQMAAAKKQGHLPEIANVLPDAHLEALNPKDGQTAEKIKLDKHRMAIGRDQRNDIVIERSTISSFHATIEHKNMVFFIEDQRSTNGTKLNDQKLQPNMPLRLKNGDVIRFSTCAFKFVVPDQIAFGETIMVAMTPLEDPQSGATVVIDLNEEGSEQHLIDCIMTHLMQLSALGSKYQYFSNTYVTRDVLELIATKAHANLEKSEASGDMHCDHLIRNKAFFVVCSLPVGIDEAAKWYENRYGGFTKFIMRWAQTPSFTQAHCDLLCFLTFGQNPATWVSMTIVPTSQEDDPVEIMSVEFLTEEEKSMLALDFDNLGQVR